MKKRFEIWRSPVVSTTDLHLYSANHKELLKFCYETWKRVTGIKLKAHESKWIQIEIKEEK